LDTFFCVRKFINNVIKRIGQNTFSFYLFSFSEKAGLATQSIPERFCWIEFPEKINIIYGGKPIGLFFFQIMANLEVPKKTNLKTRG
jgi:hypothetical protein